MKKRFSIVHVITFKCESHKHRKNSEGLAESVLDFLLSAYVHVPRALSALRRTVQQVQADLKPNTGYLHSKSSITSEDDAANTRFQFMNKHNINR